MGCDQSKEGEPVEMDLTKMDLLSCVPGEELAEQIVTAGDLGQPQGEGESSIQEIQSMTVDENDAQVGKSASIAEPLDGAQPTLWVDINYMSGDTLAMVCATPSWTLADVKREAQKHLEPDEIIESLLIGLQKPQDHEILCDLGIANVSQMQAVVVKDLPLHVRTHCAAVAGAHGGFLSEHFLTHFANHFGVDKEMLRRRFGQPQGELEGLPLHVRKHCAAHAQAHGGFLSEHFLTHFAHHFGTGIPEAFQFNQAIRTVCEAKGYYGGGTEAETKHVPEGTHGAVVREANLGFWWIHFGPQFGKLAVHPSKFEVVESDLKAEPFQVNQVVRTSCLAKGYYGGGTEAETKHVPEGTDGTVLRKACLGYWWVDFEPPFGSLTIHPSQLTVIDPPGPDSLKNSIPKEDGEAQKQNMDVEAPNTFLILSELPTDFGHIWMCHNTKEDDLGPIVDELWDMSWMSSGICACVHTTKDVKTKTKVWVPDKVMSDLQETWLKVNNGEHTPDNERHPALYKIWLRASKQGERSFKFVMNDGVVQEYANPVKLKFVRHKASSLDHAQEISHPLPLEDIDAAHGQPIPLLPSADHADREEAALSHLNHADDQTPFSVEAIKTSAPSSSCDGSSLGVESK